MRGWWLSSFRSGLPRLSWNLHPRLPNPLLPLPVQADGELVGAFNPVQRVLGAWAFLQVLIESSLKELNNSLP